MDDLETLLQAFVLYVSAVLVLLDYYIISTIQLDVSYVHYCCSFCCRMDVKLSHILSTEGKLFSASIHPNSEEECFVAGGEDFKLYKISLQDGKEIGIPNITLALQNYYF